MRRDSCSVVGLTRKRLRGRRLKTLAAAEFFFFAHWEATLYGLSAVDTDVGLTQCSSMCYKVDDGASLLLVTHILGFHRSLQLLLFCF